MVNPEVERNLEAYRRMKDELDRTYPSGEFVVFAGGDLFSHSRSYDEIDRRVRAGGWNPQNCVLIRVGDEDESGDILGSGIFQ